MARASETNRWGGQGIAKFCRNFGVKARGRPAYPYSTAGGRVLFDRTHSHDSCPCSVYEGGFDRWPSHLLNLEEELSLAWWF